MNLNQTPQQRNNLILAAQNILKVPKENFYMGNYRSTPNLGMIIVTSPNDCGTIGCFAGHCPFFGIESLKLTPEDYKTGELSGITFVSFPKYIERVFGIKDESTVSDFLFGYKWAFSNIPIMRTPIGTYLRTYCLLTGAIDTYLLDVFVDKSINKFLKKNSIEKEEDFNIENFKMELVPCTEL